jgi:rubredoxin
LIEELKRLVLKYNIDGVQWEQFEKRTRVEALPPITACSSCGTRYDAEYGDPAGGIEPGIGFDDLPDTWLCPVCDSPKTFYARREQDRHEELSA